MRNLDKIDLILSFNCILQLHHDQKNEKFEVSEVTCIYTLVSCHLTITKIAVGSGKHFLLRLIISLILHQVQLTLNDQSYV